MQEMVNNDNHMQTQSKISRKSRQAAAENEHTVVRGTNKGQTITRTTVTNTHDMMEEKKTRLFEEHHSDPPQGENPVDTMMMDMENGDDTLSRQGGLNRGEGDVS